MADDIAKLHHRRRERSIRAENGNTYTQNDAASRYYQHQREVESNNPTARRRAREQAAAAARAPNSHPSGRGAPEPPSAPPPKRGTSPVRPGVSAKTAAGREQMGGTARTPPGHKWVFGRLVRVGS